jgi:hypothetical protein
MAFVDGRAGAPYRRLQAAVGGEAELLQGLALHLSRAHGRRWRKKKGKKEAPTIPELSRAADWMELSLAYEPHSVEAWYTLAVIYAE